MISLSYRAAHCVDGSEVLSLTRDVTGRRIEEALSEDVAQLLQTAFRPARGDDELALSMVGRPYHTALGVGVDRVSARLLRRACERLWPEGTAAPPVDRKAAFILLCQGHCVIRLSPFTGLVASRD